MTVTTLGKFGAMTSLGLVLLWPATARLEIVQRQVIKALVAQPDSEGADVLEMAASVGCGGKRLRMNAGSLGMDEAQYEAMKRELARKIRDKTPLLVSLDACPRPEAVAEAAVPVIRKLVGCSPRQCQDGKARLYLDENLFPQERGRSPYVLELPLPPGKQKNTWRVDIYTAQQSSTLRFRGHIDSPDYSVGNKVGGYTYFYRDGQIEKQVPQNARGMEDGVATSYYPDGTLQSRSHWRDGLSHGTQSQYHRTGKLREAAEYRNGIRVDGPAETFDENGKLRDRMNYVNGQLDGELLSYYPDGTVSGRTAISKGKFQGPSALYYPDGSLHISVSHVNDAPDGEELEYHPNGKLAARRTYSDNGVMRSDERYSDTGVLLVQRQWDKRSREQGTFRSWYENGKPQQLIEYVDGVREGWSRTWNSDGTLEKECRFVAGKGCETEG